MQDQAVGHPTPTVTDPAVPRAFPAEGSIRRLWPVERALFAAHLLRLDAEDRLLRFQGYLNDEAVSAYVDSLDWFGGVVIAYFVDGEVRAAAHLSWNRGQLVRTGEIGLSVEAEFRRRGVGTALLRRAMTIVRNRFVSDVELLCMPENTAMRRVAAHLGLKWKVASGQAESAAHLHWPDQLSLFDEMMAETEGLMRSSFGLAKT
ncbi:MAG: GNAT family N-acetyltransferase [Alphaproteobacteria bacterium]|nr:GNAT family N-acetyltransferase [Alphaproteobacteria bacterium]